MARTLSALLLFAAAAAAQARAPAQERQPGFLGVTAAPLDAETRAHFELPEAIEAGVVLMDIVDGSAAANAGLRAGDVLVSFDGKPVGSFEELRDRVSAHAAGDAVAYVVRRGTGTIEGTLKLGGRPAEVVEEHVEVAPMEAPESGGLGERLDRVQEEIERLRGRVREERTARPLRHPTSLGGWIHQEELALQAAKKSGDERKTSWHAARLSVLREMNAAEARLPERRLERMEKKLDLILQMLKER